MICYNSIVTFINRRFYYLEGINNKEESKMKIAIVGDVHGRINEMYKHVSNIENALNLNLGTIIQIGDFHAIRDENDLRFFPAPEKYRKLGDFPSYFQRGKVPIKTYFIGGNHDNNHWHSEHPKGHELIRDLHYLGRSGIKSFNGINIGWISGNYSEVGFNGKKRKKVKYNHFTREDVDKLVSSGEKVDILLFHDWPSIRNLNNSIIEGSISHPDNLEFALKRNFGSQELYDVVKELKPKYVFAGHIHMPLDLEAIVDGSKIRFIALDKLRDSKNTIYTLDTNNISINHYIIEKGYLTDPIKGIPNLEKAFSYLESNRLEEARKLSEPFLSKTYSNEVRSFAHYFIGTSYFKEVMNGDVTNLDNSVFHLKESTNLLNHADSYLLLGNVLRHKLICLFDEKSFGQLSIIEKLAKNSVSAFQTAARLNKSYTSQAEEAIKDLNGIVDSAGK